MGFWKKLFNDDDSEAKFRSSVKDKYGLHYSDGAFVFKGSYVNLPPSDVQQTAGQIADLTTNEICLMLTNPLVIVLPRIADADAAAVRTSLDPSDAQRLIELVQPADLSASESGNICLLTLR